MAGKKKENRPGQMRIRLCGHMTTAEARVSFHHAMTKLEEMGVTHMDSTYVYMTMCDKRKTPVTPRHKVRRGGPVTEILIEEPYRSAADELGA